MLGSSERIPELLMPILGSLDELDEVKKKELWYRERSLMERERPRRYSGRDLLLNATEKGFLHPSVEYPYSVKGKPINVIPSYGKTGPCTEILLVFVGDSDNFEIRVLEAIEHCAVLCHGITKYIIFYSMKWNEIIWKKHENSFKLTGVTVVLKLFGRHPIRVL